MPLDPHVRRLLRTLALAGPGDAAPSVAQRREAFAGLMRFGETGARVAHVEDRVILGALASRVYTPSGGAQRLWPGLVFLHGGGFVCGDLDTHDALCRALCEQGGCKVIAVDYRLAPEHPFPAAIEDVFAATMWVLERPSDLGLDAARIGIAGDSAGATLAAVVARMVARSRPGALALQVLLCPILDFAAATNSRQEFGEGFLLDSDVMAAELACYLPPGQDPADPRVSPLRATDLGALPPALIHTADCDPLRDEGRAYADRLRLAGVDVRHTCHGGMVHMFYALGGLVPYARVALTQIGAEVRAAFA
jgi:acetyl esterase/lipase